MSGNRKNGRRIEADRVSRIRKKSVVRRVGIEIGRFGSSVEGRGREARSVFVKRED